MIFSTDRGHLVAQSVERQPSVAAVTYGLAGHSFWSPRRPRGLASELDIGGKRVGIILTGGKVDLNALPWM
jgi:hypothetical protein